jgi:hypothetical protein
MTTTAAPRQGQLVQVRYRPWVVDEADPSNLAPPVMERTVTKTQNPLPLTTVEDDGLGEELQVLWLIELGGQGAVTTLGRAASRNTAMMH